MSDRYDPQTNTLHFADGRLDEWTPRNIAIFAHECGHALQVKPLAWVIACRNLFTIPAILWVIWALGCACLRVPLWECALGGGGDLFAFWGITLILELDASRRAMQIIADGFLVCTPEEVEAVKRILAGGILSYIFAWPLALPVVLAAIVRDISRPTAGAR